MTGNVDRETLFSMSDNVVIVKGFFRNFRRKLYTRRRLD